MYGNMHPGHPGNLGGQPSGQPSGQSGGGDNEKKELYFPKEFYDELNKGKEFLIVDKKKAYELLCNKKKLTYKDKKNRKEYQYNFQLNTLKINGMEQPGKELDAFSEIIQQVGHDMEKNKCDVFDRKFREQRI